MDIVKIIQKAAAGQINKTVSEKSGIAPDKSLSIIQIIMPLLLSAMARNLAKPGGIESLLGALSKHSGEKIDETKAAGQEYAEDGEKIIGHILGNKKEQVVTEVSKSGKVSGDQVNTILNLVAPLLLQQLGSKTQSESLTGSGVAEMITKSAGAAAPKASSILNSIFDTNKDGDIADDLIKTGLSFFGSKKE